jgi:UDP-2,3-diacylglucosamine pyrophosphatase LpxH
MKLLLSRLKFGTDIFEHAVALAIIFLSSHRFVVSLAHDQRRGAAIALLVLAAALCWQRSIFRRRAGRDATRALAGFAAATAMLLRNEAVGGGRASRRPSNVRLDDTPDGSGAPHCDVVRVRALFISDVHLGTRGCQADLLIDFLRSHDAETLFLVGDIIDGWRLKSSWYWPTAHNDVVQELFRQACLGKRLVCVPGNHDEFLRDYTGTIFGGIEVLERAIHSGADGRDYLIIHGDHFDFVIRHARWLAVLGDWAYRAALVSNVGFNHIRRKLGLSYWSFSAWAKLSVKNAVNHIGLFEQILSAEAKRCEVQGVICGHIHHAMMHDQFGVRYINTGDWVESCTGVVEHYDGRFEIIHWTQARSSTTQVEPRPAPFAKVAA